MFLLLGVFWVGLGSLPLIRAIRTRSQDGSRGRFVRAFVVLGLDIVVLIAVNVYFGLATEFWWFSAVGFGRRFWTEYSVRLLLFALGAAAGALGFGFGLRAVVAPEHLMARRVILVGGLVTGGIVLGLIANALWQPVLLFLNRVPSGAPDPIFGLDLSFYLFVLPLAEELRARLLGALFIYVIAAAVAISLSRREISGDVGPLGLIARSRRLRAQVAGAGGVFLLLVGTGSLLSIPELMYSTEGAVTGVGWLEANVLAPANLVAAVVWSGSGIALLTGTVSERIVFRLLAIRRVERPSFDAGASPTSHAGGRGAGESADDGKESGTDARASGRSDTPSTPEPEVRLTSRSWVAPAVLVVGLFLITFAVPSLIRGVVLNPNEITLESEYIPYHVDYTRSAFGIDDENVTSTEYPAGRDITADVLEANEPTLDNIRLWDSRALQDNLEQQQEIRLYYEFHDVDIDRYVYEGDLTEMMLSIRELEKSHLADESQTWVSRHFKYTHGHGLVALPVHEFLPQGRPDLVVRNIPPRSQVSRFEISRPEIYYGERTADHVYVKTTQREFDYPSGDENVYTDYAGHGGIPIGGLVRRLAFAWRIDGYRQLFSSYITGESRVMFRRRIVERARVIAPFLRYDRDPYPVVTEDGRIVYIIDAYTTSRDYPYSERYAGVLDAFTGVNYIRNSVKVVVDAYDGSVDFYVVTPDDPIISTFERIFPELFAPLGEMPEDLKDHIRYPTDLLTVQAETYSVYHMTNTQVFYQREDVWEFATERYRASFQPVEPYYVLLEYPGEERLEFSLMLPFTPANKNVINAWMAGRSDYENYGTLTVYTLPKGVEVLGPRQIEARIDQNTEMSRALSLWGQRGSEVIRGNLLAIPLFNDDGLYILYVEPIYLQAEDAALPEIKRVALADQSRVVWDENFDTALRRLLGELPATPGAVEQPASQDAAGGGSASGAQAAGAAATGLTQQELVAQANQAFEDYRRSVADGRYDDAGAALQRLADALAQLETQ